MFTSFDKLEKSNSHYESKPATSTKITNFYNSTKGISGLSPSETIK